MAEVSSFSMLPKWLRTNLQLRAELKQVLGELYIDRLELEMVRRERNEARTAFDELKTHRKGSANWTAGRKTTAFLDSLDLRDSEVSALACSLNEWIRVRLTHE